MKRLSDYVGQDAIDLWADLLESITAILGDKKIADVYREGKPPFLIAREVLKLHGADAIKIMERIDPTPVNGLNAITRVMEIIVEVQQSDDLKIFFGSAGEVKTSKEFSGAATANTGAETI